MSSGWCELCQMFHTASCYHPASLILAQKDKQIAALTAERDALKENFGRVAQQLHEDSEFIATQGGQLTAARQKLAECKERLVLWREFEREMEIIVDNGIHITLLIPAKTIDKLKDLGEI